MELRRAVAEGDTMSTFTAAQANQQFVDRLIVQGALWSPQLIAAFRATPRHRFLDYVYQYQPKSARWREVRIHEADPEGILLAYSDRALITHLSPTDRSGESYTPISSSSQPSLMAQMLEDLQLAASLRVLEIGAGTGYNAALLAHRLSSGMVYSLDVDRQVLAEAQTHLQSFTDRHVKFRHADGRAGWVEKAPFDRILVTAATPDLEPAWLNQLSPAGILLAPLALAPGLAYVVRGIVREGVFHGRLTRAAYFMPLRAEGESGCHAEGNVPYPAACYTVAAPWESWFDHKSWRSHWIRFVQALAFYGLLRGLNVFYQAWTNQPPMFGVGDAASDSICWLGTHTWHIHNESGRQLGWELWRAFLNAGGPWPTEFRLRASPQGGLRSLGGCDGYIRQGPLCQQAWDLIEQRDRPMEM